MEEAKRLAELAVKLEEYRYRIVAALAWVVFGMIFGAATTLSYALAMLGLGNWVFPLAVATAGICGCYIYGRFWRFAPPETRGPDLMLPVLPIAVAYALPVFVNLPPAYFSVAWYPALGVGLLLYYGRKKLRAKLRPVAISGAAIIATSPLLIAASSNPAAAGLLGVGMMMLIYFVTAVKTFFDAEKVLYA